MMIAPLLAALVSFQSPPTAPVVAGMNAFSRALFAAAPIRPLRNVILSPYSVSSCLALLLPGMGEGDQKRLMTGLKLRGMEPSEAVAAFGLLNGKVSSAANGQLQMANGVWVASRYAFTAEYLRAVQVGFLAQAGRLPGSGAAGVKLINDWISGATKGRIPHLLDHLDRATAAVLVNAISFDANWQHPFAPGRTEPKNFKRPNGSTNVPMMAESLSTSTYAGSNYTAVELPYRSGGFSMLVLLPREGGDPVRLLKDLDLSNLPRGEHKRVDLELPKFKFSTRLSLIDSLRELGLSSVLSGFDARPMLNQTQPMKVSQLLHGAEIEVDEKGTRAAAATVGTMMPTAIRREDPMTFHVDRPFAFVIRSTATGAPLFVGAVYDPAA